MRKAHSLLCFFAALNSFYFISFANVSSTDSLHNAVRLVLNDSATWKSLDKNDIEHIRQFKFSGNLSELALFLAGCGDSCSKKSDFSGAIRFYQVAADISSFNKDTLRICDYCDRLGFVYRRIGDYKSALTNHLKALELKEMSAEKKKLHESYINIGKIYREQSNYPQALYYLDRAIETCRSSGDTASLSSSFIGKGRVYREMGDFPESLKCYLHALNMMKQTGITTEIGYTFDEIGKIYLRNGDLAQALLYHQQAAQAEEEAGENEFLGFTYVNIGDVYNIAGNLNKALEYYLKSVDIRKKIGHKMGIVLALNKAGQVCNAMKKSDNAFAYQLEALTLALETNSKTLIKDTHLELSMTCLAQSNHKKALEHYMVYAVLKDSIFSEESLSNMARMEARIETEKKDREIEMLKKTQLISDLEIMKSEAEVKKQRIYIFSAVGAFLLVCTLIALLYNRFKLKKKANEALHEMNKKITDSINYAERIQRSLIPDEEALRSIFPDSFIIFRPRDIVSGDFPWLYIGDMPEIHFAAVDCTGHGVPGAFMSVIGHTLLNEILKGKKITRPAEILHHLNEDVNQILKQSDIKNPTQKDGMELALCRFMPTSENKNGVIGSLEFSGAHRPLLYLNREKLSIINGDKISIAGGSAYGKLLIRKKSVKADHDEIQFTNHSLDVYKGDTVFLFSDGFTDQFGKNGSNKYGIPRLMQCIEANAHIPMNELRKILTDDFLQWMGDKKQLDDVLFIGIRL